MSSILKANSAIKPPQSKHRIFSLPKATKEPTESLFFSLKPAADSKTQVNSRFNNEVAFILTSKEYPIFTKDKLYYTQSFQSKQFEPEQRQRYLEIRKRQMDDKIEEENKKCLNEADLKIELQCPETLFCVVCLQYFDSYWEHIKSKNHRQNNEKPTMVDIWFMELTKIFMEKCPVVIVKAEKQENLKMTLSDDLSEGIPYKKVKGVKNKLTVSERKLQLWLSKNKKIEGLNQNNKKEVKNNIKRWKDILYNFIYIIQIIYSQRYISIISLIRYYTIQNSYMFKLNIMIIFVYFIHFDNLLNWFIYLITVVVYFDICLQQYQIQDWNKIIMLRKLQAEQQPLSNVNLRGTVHSQQSFRKTFFKGNDLIHLVTDKKQPGQQLEKGIHSPLYRTNNLFTTGKKNQRNDSNKNNSRHEMMSCSPSRISEDKFKEIEEILNRQNNNLKEHRDYLVGEVRKFSQTINRYRTKLKKYKQRIVELEHQKDVYKLQCLQMKQYVFQGIGRMQNIVEENPALDQEQIDNLPTHKNLHNRHQFTLMPKSEKLKLQAKVIDNYDNIQNTITKHLEELNTKFQALMIDYRTTKNHQSRRQCIELAKEIKNIKAKLNNTESNISQEPNLDIQTVQENNATMKYIRALPNQMNNPISIPIKIPTNTQMNSKVPINFEMNFNIPEAKIMKKGSAQLPKNQDINESINPRRVTIATNQTYQTSSMNGQMTPNQSKQIIYSKFPNNGSFGNNKSRIRQ